MKKFLGILVLGLLLSSNAYTDIIQNKCFGYQGHGDLSQNKSNKTWIEIIDTEKKTYKWKSPDGDWKPHKGKIIYMDNEIMKTKHKDITAAVDYWNGIKPKRQSFLEKRWVKILFSISIMVSAIPSIYQDFTYGHQGEWTHYGMMLIGLLYFIESLLWTLDIWKA